MSFVEGYFNRFGGWGNAKRMRERLLHVLCREVGIECAFEDSAVAQGFAADVLRRWYDFVDAYTRAHGGRTPYTWIVADHVEVLPDEQVNADFWESFIDELSAKQSIELTKRSPKMRMQ